MAAITLFWWKRVVVGKLIGAPSLVSWPFHPCPALSCAVTFVIITRILNCLLILKLARGIDYWNRCDFPITTDRRPWLSESRFSPKIVTAIPGTTPMNIPKYERYCKIKFICYRMSTAHQHVGRASTVAAIAHQYEGRVYGCSDGTRSRGSQI